MIVFECPDCNRKLTVADNHAGKKMGCPNCKARITIPPDNAAALPIEPSAIFKAKTQLAPANGERQTASRTEFEETPRPSPRRNGSGLGLWLALITAVLAFLMGSASIVVVISRSFAKPDVDGMMRTAGKEHLAKYSFSSPKESLLAEHNMEADLDVLAMLEFHRQTKGLREIKDKDNSADPKEWTKTLEVRKEMGATADSTDPAKTRRFCKSPKTMEAKNAGIFASCRRTSCTQKKWSGRK